MGANTKVTSDTVAQLASETLRDPYASAIAKRLAGSALAQALSTKQTGAAMEHEAGMVLQSDKYSETTKTLAGSLVSQSNKSR
ncbi:hypothetical protein [Pseudomonas sp.]|uniref:hypothetical protein n=1 Tax=Pseudomonas sp. TaxID=306 RepID=UPI00258ED602|nr:hypothetical protein [Pseudomonas sp.]